MSDSIFHLAAVSEGDDDDERLVLSDNDRLARSGGHLIRVIDSCDGPTHQRLPAGKPDALPVLSRASFFRSRNRLTHRRGSVNQSQAAQLSSFCFWRLLALYVGRAPLEMKGSSHEGRFPFRVLPQTSEPFN